MTPAKVAEEETFKPECLHPQLEDPQTEASSEGLRSVPSDPCGQDSPNLTARENDGGGPYVHVLIPRTCQCELTRPKDFADG